MAFKTDVTKHIIKRSLNDLVVTSGTSKKNESSKKHPKNIFNKQALKCNVQIKQQEG